jgi:hypothetical protein
MFGAFAFSIPGRGHMFWIYPAAILGVAAVGTGLFKLGAMSVLVTVLALALKAESIVLLAVAMAVIAHYVRRWLNRA